MRLRNSLSIISLIPLYMVTSYFYDQTSSMLIVFSLISFVHITPFEFIVEGNRKLYPTDIEVSNVIIIVLFIVKILIYVCVAPYVYTHYKIEKILFEFLPVHFVMIFIIVKILDIANDKRFSEKKWFVFVLVLGNVYIPVISWVGFYLFLIFMEAFLKL